MLTMRWSKKCHIYIYKITNANAFLSSSITFTNIYVPFLLHMNMVSWTLDICFIEPLEINEILLVWNWLAPGWRCYLQIRDLFCLYGKALELPVLFLCLKSLKTSFWIQCSCFNSFRLSTHSNPNTHNTLLFSA